MGYLQQYQAEKIVEQATQPAQTTSKASIHQKKFCYQFGGITKELSILNSYHPTERSILSSTLNN